MTKMVDPSKLTNAAMISGAPSATAPDLQWWSKIIPNGCLLDKPSKSAVSKFSKKVRY
jgi:hypothetical protein